MILTVKDIMLLRLVSEIKVMTHLDPNAAYQYYQQPSYHQGYET
jgi:hypothetical protein